MDYSTIIYLILTFLLCLTPTFILILLIIVTKRYVNKQSGFKNELIRSIRFFLLILIPVTISLGSFIWAVMYVVTS